MENEALAGMVWVLNKGAICSHNAWAISWECGCSGFDTQRCDMLWLVILSDMEHFIVGLSLQLRLGSVYMLSFN